MYIHNWNSYTLNHNIVLYINENKRIIYTVTERVGISLSIQDSMLYTTALILCASSNDGDVSILIIFMVYHVPRTIIQHFWKLQIHDQLSDCWARNVLILCNNSFFTLSGTRAAKEKSKYFITT